MTIEEMQRAAYDMAQSKGFGLTIPQDIPQALALVHSEVSEALEEVRADTYDRHYHDTNGKPLGFAAELADIVIRVGHLAGACHIDLQKAIEEKMAYNAGRAHKHGKNF